MAIGDMERRVVNTRRVGEGENTFGTLLNPFLVLVGLGLEHILAADDIAACRGLLRSSDLQDQFSATSVRSSQLCDSCITLCTSRS